MQLKDFALIFLHALNYQILQTLAARAAARAVEKPRDVVQRQTDALRLANLARFTKVVADYQAAAHRGGRPPKWPHLLHGLAWYITGHATGPGSYSEQTPDVLPDADAVFLGDTEFAAIDPELLESFGTALIFIAIPETMVILGFVVAIVLMFVL